MSNLQPGDKGFQITWGASTFTIITETKIRGYSNWLSEKWQCDVCGRFGYGDPHSPREWARSCARGHSPCPWCERPISVCLDGSQRVHTRCDKRPDAVEDKWTDAKVTPDLTRTVVAEGVDR